MIPRRLLVAGGVLAFAVGVVEMIAVGLVPLPIDRTIVYLIGVLPLIQAYRVVRARRHTEVREAGTPDPERPPETPPPGADFEDALGQITGSRRQFSYSGIRIREALRTVAIDVLTQYGGYSADGAQAAVEAGEWTESPVAAAFLGGDDVPPPPFRTRARMAVGGASMFQAGVRETVDAIARRAGLETPQSGGDRLPFSVWRGRNTAGDDRGAPTTGTRGAESPRGETGGDLTPLRRETGYWRGVGAIALVSVGVGILFQTPAVVLTGIVGLGYGAVGRYGGTPDIDLAVDRTVSDTRPAPGDDVDVTVTVENTGARTLWDVRLVDGVPPALSVAEGSPRHGTALRPGESADFSYTVTARRGRHDFSPVLVLTRTLTNTVEHERFEPVTTRLECIPPLRPTPTPLPLRARATRFAGQVATDAGGEGIEFHATRAYRAGDPLSRIDWNRRARTGEFATLEFREERAASVVLLIDARPPAYVGPVPDEGHAVDRSVDAARQTFQSLLADGHQVGIAVLGVADCWVPPRTGREHRARVREVLAVHPAVSPIPPTTYPNVGRVTNRLHRQLDAGTQIVAFSALVDRGIGRVVGELDARGYPVTVVSPDATADGTPGQRLARIGRRLRMSDLRHAGIPVVDWPWAEPFDAAVIRHIERGRQ